MAGIDMTAANEVGAAFAKKAVFTGSFDPFTKGHLDIVRRAARIFDEITVAICVNTEKSGGMFTPEERILIAENSIETLKMEVNCTIKSEICPNLLADFAAERGIGVIIRGARTAGEFEYEVQMAEVNRALAGLESVIFPASPELAFISSTVARDMIIYGRPEVALADGAAELACRLMAEKSGKS